MSTVFVLQFIPAQNSLSFSSHGIPGCRFPLEVNDAKSKLQFMLSWKWSREAGHAYFEQKNCCKS